MKSVEQVCLLCILYGKVCVTGISLHPPIQLETLFYKMGNQCSQQTIWAKLVSACADSPLGGQHILKWLLQGTTYIWDIRIRKSNAKTFITLSVSWKKTKSKSADCFLLCSSSTSKCREALNVLFPRQFQIEKNITMKRQILTAVDYLSYIRLNASENWLSHLKSFK